MGVYWEGVIVNCYGITFLFSQFRGAMARVRGAFAFVHVLLLGRLVSVFVSADREAYAV